MTVEEVNASLGIITEDTIVDDILLPSEEEADETATMTQEELIAAYKALKGSKKETSNEAPTGSVDDIAALYNTTNGQLTEEHYAELASKGLSQETIDTYVEGLRSTETKKFTDLISSVGSVEDYATALSYASENWTEDQIVSYNEILQGSNEGAKKMVIGMLLKEASNASASGSSDESDNGPITETKRTTARTTRGYETKSDYMKDMNSSRYKTDAAYRNKVDEKFLITDTNTWY